MSALLCGGASHGALNSYKQLTLPLYKQITRACDSPNLHLSLN